MTQKTRFAFALGLSQKESAWVWTTFETVDYSTLVLAGATTIRSLVTGAVLFNPSTALKSPDSYPSQQPGGTLTAINNARQIGSGNAPFSYLTGVYVVHITAAGAVYAPAGTTIQIKVSSTVTTLVGAAVNLTAAFNVTTGANGVDSVPIVAPADRSYNLEGQALTTVAAIFNGDIVFCELVTTGGLTVNPNILGVLLEFGA